MKEIILTTSFDTINWQAMLAYALICIGLVVISSYLAVKIDALENAQFPITISAASMVALFVFESTKAIIAMKEGEITVMDVVFDILVSIIIGGLIYLIGMKIYRSIYDWYYLVESRKRHAELEIRQIDDDPEFADVEDEISDTGYYTGYFDDCYDEDEKSPFTEEFIREVSRLEPGKYFMDHFGHFHRIQQ